MATARSNSKMLILRALLVLYCFVALLEEAGATVTDLSSAWTEGSLYNQNKAYCTIQANLNPSTTIGYVVIQNGQLLAEAYTAGNDQNGKYDAWSVTKSWSTMIIGYMVALGQVATNETLNDIFNQDSDWIGVEQVAEKKTITLEELLTMTSGLTDSACGQSRASQESLQEVLNAVSFDASQRGRFFYLGRIHILAQIINRRSGLTPRQFVQNNGIFTKLGVAETDYEWTTFGGVEGSAFGLQTNPQVMAKLGQLYLQDELAAP
jgi:CubicO group peptidase (beta-lactamase class C family)